METQELKRVVEALSSPLTRRSAPNAFETLELKNGFALGALIDELNSEYQQSGAFTIRQVAAAIKSSRNRVRQLDQKALSWRQKTRLSQAALETGAGRFQAADQPRRNRPNSRRQLRWRYRHAAGAQAHYISGAPKQLAGHCSIHTGVSEIFQP
jgi:hypothetical protein